jgi:hypothetical protein
MALLTRAVKGNHRGVYAGARGRCSTLRANGGECKGGRWRGWRVYPVARARGAGIMKRDVHASPSRASWTLTVQRGRGCLAAEPGSWLFVSPPYLSARCRSLDGRARGQLARPDVFRERTKPFGACFRLELGEHGTRDEDRERLAQFLVGWQRPASQSRHRHRTPSLCVGTKKPAIRVAYGGPRCARSRVQGTLRLIVIIADPMRWPRVRNQGPALAGPPCHPHTLLPG